MTGRRKRIIQIAAGLATCAVVGASALVLPLRPSLAARGSQDSVQKQGERAPDPKGQDQPAPLPAEIALEPQPAPPMLEPTPPAPSAVADPEKDAEEFVVRTRAEASARVNALEREARDLRIRLAKVEAAATKLKAAFGVPDEPKPPLGAPLDNAIRQNLPKEPIQVAPDPGVLDPPDPGGTPPRPKAQT